MAPRQRANIPFLSPHAPELLYCCGIVKFATAAHLHCVSSYGATGQQTNGMDSLLGRLVKAGLMGTVSVPSNTPGRQVRAYFLTAAGYRGAGLDESRAESTLKLSREKARVIERLRVVETWLSTANWGWRMARIDARYSCLRSWALNLGRGHVLDGTPQLLMNGLKKTPANSEFGSSGAHVMFRLNAHGEVDDAIILLSAVSVAEAKARAENLPPLLGCVSTFRFGIIGTEDVRAQFSRTIAKTLGKRGQQLEISAVEGDFRLRTALLGRAATEAERVYLALRSTATFPWPGPAQLAAMARFGWRDLSIVSAPLVRPPMSSRPSAPAPPPPPPPAPEFLEEEDVDLMALPLFDGRVGRSIMSPVVLVAPAVAPAAPRVQDPRMTLCSPRTKGIAVPDVELNGRGM